MFENLRALMAQAGNPTNTQHDQALQALAAELQEPVQEAIFPGDIFSDLFTVQDKPMGWDGRYTTDLVEKDQTRQFKAYVISHQGMLAKRVLETNFIRVPTYENGNHVEVPLREIELCDFDAMARALEVLEGGCVEKMNSDCWKTAIKAAADRNTVVYDSTATAGYLSKRLLRLLQVYFRRSAGNSNSMNRFKMSRLYMSCELMASLVALTNTALDDTTRREITLSDEGLVTGWYGLEFRELLELGADQEYQDYFDDTLGGTLPGSTTELVVGFDLSPKGRKRLVMPVTKRPQVWEDGRFHREGLASLYTRFEHGTAVLDNRVVLLGAA